MDCIVHDLHKALRVVELSIRVDNLSLGFKSIVAPGTAHTIHVHDAEITRQDMTDLKQVFRG